MSVPSFSEGSALFFFAGAVGTALLGGWHCAGMCGPIAALARDRWAVVAHQTGRLAAYLGLGAFAGAVGEHVLHILPQEHLWIAGAVLGLLAFWMMLSAWKLESLRTVQRFLWRNRPRGSLVAEYFTLGALNGILPCHFLYGFLVAAAGLGSPARAMILMACLWAGSLPWLVASALIGRRVRRSPRFSQWVAPALFFAVLVCLVFHQAHQHHGH